MSARDGCPVCTGALSRVTTVRDGVRVCSMCGDPWEGEPLPALRVLSRHRTMKAARAQAGKYKIGLGWIAGPVPESAEYPLSVPYGFDFVQARRRWCVACVVAVRHEDDDDQGPGDGPPRVPTRKFLEAVRARRAAAPVPRGTVLGLGGVA